MHDAYNAIQGHKWFDMSAISAVTDVIGGSGRTYSDRIELGRKLLDDYCRELKRGRFDDDSMSGIENDAVSAFQAIYEISREEARRKVLQYWKAAREVFFAFVRPGPGG